MREILLLDKTKIKNYKIKPEEKERLTLVVDMLANTVESEDKDAIFYAFTSFYYATKVHKHRKLKRKKVEKLVKEILNAI